LENLTDIALRKSTSPAEKMFLYLKKSEIQKKNKQDKIAIKTLIQSYDIFKTENAIDPNRYPFIKDLYLNIIKEMDILKNYEVGKNVAIELVNMIPTEYRGYFYAGKFFFINKEFDNARSALNEAGSILEYTYAFRFGRPLYAQEDAAEI